MSWHFDRPEFLDLESNSGCRGSGPDGRYFPAPEVTRLIVVLHTGVLELEIVAWHQQPRRPKVAKSLPAVCHKKTDSDVPAKKRTWTALVLCVTEAPYTDACRRMFSMRFHGVLSMSDALLVEFVQPARRRCSY